MAPATSRRTLRLRTLVLSARPIGPLLPAHSRHRRRQRAAPALITFDGENSALLSKVRASKRCLIKDMVNAGTADVTERWSVASSYPFPSWVEFTAGRHFVRVRV